MARGQASPATNSPFLPCSNLVLIPGETSSTAHATCTNTDNDKFVHSEADATLSEMHVQPFGSPCSTSGNVLSNHRQGSLKRLSQPPASDTEHKKGSKGASSRFVAGSPTSSVLPSPDRKPTSGGKERKAGGKKSLSTSPEVQPRRRSPLMQREDADTSASACRRPEPAEGSFPKSSRRDIVSPTPSSAKGSLIKAMNLQRVIDKAQQPHKSMQLKHAMLPSDSANIDVPSLPPDRPASVVPTLLLPPTASHSEPLDGCVSPPMVLPRGRTGPISPACLHPGWASLIDELATEGDLAGLATGGLAGQTGIEKVPEDVTAPQIEEAPAQQPSQMEEAPAQQPFQMEEAPAQQPSQMEEAPAQQPSQMEEALAQQPSQINMDAEFEEVDRVPETCEGEWQGAAAERSVVEDISIGPPSLLPEKVVHFSRFAPGPASAIASLVEPSQVHLSHLSSSIRRIQVASGAEISTHMVSSASEEGAATVGMDKDTAQEEVATVGTDKDAAQEEVTSIGTDNNVAQGEVAIVSMDIEAAHAASALPAPIPHPLVIQSGGLPSFHHEAPNLPQDSFLCEPIFQQVLLIIASSSYGTLLH